MCREHGELMSDGLYWGGLVSQIVCYEQSRMVGLSGVMALDDAVERQTADQLAAIEKEGKLEFQRPHEWLRVEDEERMGYYSMGANQYLFTPNETQVQIPLRILGMMQGPHDLEVLPRYGDGSLDRYLTWLGTLGEKILAIPATDYHLGYVIYHVSPEGVDQLTEGVPQTGGLPFEIFDEN